MITQEKGNDAAPGASAETPPRLLEVHALPLSFNHFYSAYSWQICFLEPPEP